MKTILKNYKNKTQQFEEKDESAEPWSSRSKKSRGWHLLYDLMIDEKSNRQLKCMTIEDLRQSNQYFECYPLDAFKKYYADMKKLTGK